MARRDDSDGKPQYPAGHGTFYGNLVEDPRELSGGAVALKVASNYRDNRGDEDTHWVGVVCFRNYAQWALDNLSKGDRVRVEGPIYGNRWETRDGEERHDIQIVADFVGEDNRFYGNNGGGGGSRRRRDDGDDEEPRRSSRRRRDDDEGEEERPSRRSGSSRRRSDDDEDDEPRRESGRRRRSRVADIGDEDDD